MEVITKNSYKESPGHHPIGVSQTVPRLSMPISELVKRFTLTTLKEMEDKSLLTYDFGPEVTEDPFKLLEKLDLSANSCIDITDVAQLKDEALRQIEEFKSAKAKEIAAKAEARKQREARAHDAFVQEAMARIKADSSVKIV